MTDRSQILSVAVTKRQGDFALDVAFDAPFAGVLGLVGPSGSGKSTLFACLAGLAKPDAGRISIGGRLAYCSTQRVDRSPAQRGVGVVFQDGLLFPHLSVRANLLYGAEKGARRSDLFEQVIDALALEPHLTRRPPSLSGGERQRVAIGRALMTRPRLLLLDEPLSSLDPERKEEVLLLLERVHAATKTPMLYVSHAPEEIARLAHRTLTLRAGRLVEPPASPPHASPPHASPLTTGGA